MKILRSPIFMPKNKEKAQFSHPMVENCAKETGARPFLPALRGQMFIPTGSSGSYVAEYLFRWLSVPEMLPSVL